MSPDGRRRSREYWTDTMEAGPPEPPAHVHRLPPVVRLAVAGLVVAVFLLLVAVGFLTVYVYQQQQYIQGKGVQRDRENAQLEEQIRQSMCDLLDQLPEGGLLQRPRAKYECGPGIPLAQLTPQEQAQIRGRAPAPTTAPSPKTAPQAPPSASPVVPKSPRPAPATPSAPREGPGPTDPPPPSAAPSSAPLVDLHPLTNPLCDALGICI